MAEVAKPVIDGLKTLSELSDIQMRNVDALFAAQQKLLEGMEMLGKQQSSVIEQALKRLSNVPQTVLPPTNLRAGIGDRIDAIKTAIVEQQANFNIASEMVTRSSAEVGNVLQARFMGALDELKTVLAETPDLPSSRFAESIQGPADGARRIRLTA
jgi:hypothetical protein